MVSKKKRAYIQTLYDSGGFMRIAVPLRERGLWALGRAKYVAKEFLNTDPVKTFSQGPGSECPFPP